MLQLLPGRTHSEDDRPVPRALQPGASHGSGPDRERLQQPIRTQDRTTLHAVTLARPPQNEPLVLAPAAALTRLLPPDCHWRTSVALASLRIRHFHSTSWPAGREMLPFQVG